MERCVSAHCEGQVGSAAQPADTRRTGWTGGSRADGSAIRPVFSSLGRMSSAGWTCNAISRVNQPLYSIDVDQRAQRELARLSREVQVRIARRIDALTSDPWPHGVERLTGARELYRVRVGDYRVIYTVSIPLRIVVIVRVGHRRDVYRRGL
jgi:mRNA interferase RelE/StbE